MTVALALLSQMLLILLVVTATVLGSIIGYLYLRARRNESTELTPQQKQELDKRDGELLAIRTRIEEIYENQRLGNDTQQALVQQQFEQLNHALRSRSREIEGLKGQLRHEIEARRAEMDQLKAQLEEAVTLVMRPQLGPARQEALSEEASTGSQAAVEKATEPEEKPVPPTERVPQERLFQDFDDDFPVELLDLDEEDREALAPIHETPDDAGSDEDSTEPEPARELVALFDAPEEDLPTLDHLALDSPAQHYDALSTAGKTNQPEEAEGLNPRPEFEPLDEEDEGFLIEPVAPTNRAETPHAEGIQAEHPHSWGDGVLWNDAQPAEETNPGMAVPEGADDLTVIETIDAARQQVLYDLGIITLSDVAHLNRTQAENIARSIGRIDPEEVATDWVFAAQSILFSRYQAEMSRQRTQAA